MNYSKALIVFAACALSLPSSANAEEKPSAGAPSLSLTGNAGIVSDYRFRGISVSDFGPAAQASFRLQHRSGAYVSVWGSTIDPGLEIGRGEIDLIAGYVVPLSDVTQLDISGTYYAYPGAKSPLRVNAAEVGTRLIHRMPGAEIAGGVAYIPAQTGTGNSDNLYVFGDLAIPLSGTPATIRSHIGRSKGAWANGGSYWDLAISTEIAIAPAIASLGLVNTSGGGGANGRSGLLATVFWNF